MIPWSHVSVAGKPIDELLREQSDRYKIEPKDVILQKVKNQGYIENSSKGCTCLLYTSDAADEAGMV